MFNISSWSCFTWASGLRSQVRVILFQDSLWSNCTNYGFSWHHCLSCQSLCGCRDLGAQRLSCCLELHVQKLSQCFQCRTMLFRGLKMCKALIPCSNIDSVERGEMFAKKPSLEHLRSGRWGCSHWCATLIARKNFFDWQFTNDTQTNSSDGNTDGLWKKQRHPAADGAIRQTDFTSENDEASWRFSWTPNASDSVVEAILLQIARFYCSFWVQFDSFEASESWNVLFAMWGLVVIFNPWWRWLCASAQRVGTCSWFRRNVSAHLQKSLALNFGLWLATQLVLFLRKNMLRCWQRENSWQWCRRFVVRLVV